MLSGNGHQSAAAITAKEQIAFKYKINKQQKCSRITEAQNSPPVEKRNPEKRGYDGGMDKQISTTKNGTKSTVVVGYASMLRLLPSP